MYMKISISDFLTLFSARTRTWFWERKYVLPHCRVTAALHLELSVLQARPCLVCSRSHRHEHVDAVRPLLGQNREHEQYCGRIQLAQ
jgi:hypothetical protein